MMPSPAQGDATVQHTDLRQGEVQDELMRLEAAIGNLVSLQQNPKHSKDAQPNAKRTFGLRKIFHRRANSKNATSLDNEESVAERIKNIEKVCEDLKCESEKTANVNMASKEEDSKPESRDDVDMTYTCNSNSKSEELVRGQTEMLKAIRACTDILSQIKSRALAETPDSKTVYNEDSLETSGDQETMTELNDDFEEAFEDNEANKCNILEVIENLRGSLIKQENMDEMSRDETTEEKDESSERYFCGISEVWCFRSDEELLPGNDEYPTDEESASEPVIAKNSIMPMEENSASALETDQIEQQEKETESVAQIKQDEVEHRTEDETSLDQNETITNLEDSDILPGTALNCNVFGHLCSLVDKELEEEEFQEDAQKESGLDSLEVVVQDENAKNDDNWMNESNEEMPKKDSQLQFDRVPTVTTMDCIPRIEVVGLKSPKNHENEQRIPKKNRRETKKERAKKQPAANVSEEKRAKADSHYVFEEQKTSKCHEPVLDNAGCEVGNEESLQTAGIWEEKTSESTDETHGFEKHESAGRPQVKTVSTMDFIPHFEVVGFKKSGSTNAVEQRKNAAGKRTNSVGQRRKLSKPTKATRRKVPGKREKNRSLRRLLDQGRHVGHSVLSDKQTKKMDGDDALQIDSHPISSEKQGDSPLADPDNIAARALQNLRDQSQRGESQSMYIGNDMMYCVSPMDQSELHTSSAHNKQEYVTAISSSLSSWTGYPSAFKENGLRENDDEFDGVIINKKDVEGVRKGLKEMQKKIEDMKNNDLFSNLIYAIKKKQGNVDQEIVECLSPVLSIPMGESYETKHEFGEEFDDEYVNHYYDFRGDKNDEEEYSDDEGGFSDDDNCDYEDFDNSVVSAQTLDEGQASMRDHKMDFDQDRRTKVRDDANNSRDTKVWKKLVVETRDFDQVCDAAMEEQTEGDANDQSKAAPKTPKKKRVWGFSPKGRNRSQKKSETQFDGSAATVGPHVVAAE